MKLEVTKEAQEVLKNKLEADDQLLLDIDFTWMIHPHLL